MTGSLLQVHATPRIPGALRDRGSTPRRASMPHLILPVSATAMAIPATVALPEAAQAQRYYSNGAYVGPTWRGGEGAAFLRGPNRTTRPSGGGAGRAPCA